MKKQDTNKWKYIKNGKIKGIEIIEKPIKEFILEYPILTTIYIQNDKGELETKQAYSRSGLAYKFSDDDIISIKKPSRNEFKELKEYIETEKDVDEFEILDIKLNGEKANYEYFGNILTTQEFSDLVNIIGNFIIDLKVMIN